MKPTHESIGPAVPGILPITSIEPSPTNPRKTFDADKLTQLGETIRSQGFLQKLLVRPWPGRDGVFELVDGERRYRAARQLGIDMLPVDVRNLTDAQVIEIQLIAGETGEPLTPLEEAHGFRNALELKDGDKSIYTAESLAVRIGREKTYVYRALKLIALPTDAHAAMAQGTLMTRTAHLLARIPTPELRAKAVAEIVRPNHRPEPLTYLEAAALIHERYMVSLRSAPFDVNDATLLGPDATPLACAKCPLKTGNDAERFADVKDKNVCTSPACYRAKCNATWDRSAAKAKASGQRVLSDEEAAEVFEKNSPTVQIAFSSQYVDVNARPTYRHVANEVEDKNLPTWRELIESAAEKKGIKVPIVLARDRTGKQWELVQLTLAIEAARAIGEDMFKKVPSSESLNPKDRFDRDTVRNTIRSTDDFEQKKKAEAEATKKRTAENCLALVRLHDALSLKILGYEAITDALLHTALHHAGNDGQALFTKAFGLQTGGGDFDHSDAIEAWFNKRSKSDRHAAIPVLLVAPSMKWNGLKCEGFTALAESVKLDVAAIEKEAAAQLAAKGKPAKKGKAAPAAASAPTSAAAPSRMRSFYAVKSSRGTVMVFEWNAKEIADAVMNKGLVGLIRNIEAEGSIPAEAEAKRRFASGQFEQTAIAKLDEDNAKAGQITDGQYIAAKTLMTAGKELRNVQEQLSLTNAQVTAVLKRFNEERGVEKKKRDAGKTAEAAVRGSLKKTPGKAGKKGGAKK